MRIGDLVKGWRFFDGSTLVRSRERWQVIDLLAQLVQREVTLRYRGAFLGLFASLINPLLMLGTYAVIFGWVFNSHFGLKPNETRADYVLGLYCGLVLFNYFAECLNRAPTLILANPNYVKKVVFPLEVIPISINLAALFHLAISVLPLLAALICFDGGINPGILWILLILLPLVLFTQAVLWFLSALGVFVRDTGLLIGTFSQILMFGSAIFYRIDSLPEPFRHIVALKRSSERGNTCERQKCRCQKITLKIPCLMKPGILGRMRVRR
jgi:lipopolysaccharide transport system permease protein